MGRRTLPVVGNDQAMSANRCYCIVAVLSHALLLSITMLTTRSTQYSFVTVYVDYILQYRNSHATVTLSSLRESGSVVKTDNQPQQRHVFCKCCHEFLNPGHNNNIIRYV